MAPSRRNSNGRSPLVNPQRQITSFFSKSASPSPSPTLSKTNHKPNPNPSPTSLTPSPLNPKPHKSIIVIGASSSSPPSASPSLCGQDVVGRRIKVYWPLDNAWYEGSVKSFDSIASKHVVCYDDDEEESLDLTKEKIEWIQDFSSRKLKRLRRGGGVPVLRKMVIDDDDEEEGRKGEEEDDDNDNGDDSNDEDWGKNAVLEDAGDNEEDTDLEDEDDISESATGKKVEPKKRKLSGMEKKEPAKKSKSGVEVGKGAFKLSVMEPTSNLESKSPS